MASLFTDSITIIFYYIHMNSYDFICHFVALPVQLTRAPNGMHPLHLQDLQGLWLVNVRNIAVLCVYLPAPFKGATYRSFIVLYSQDAVVSVGRLCIHGLAHLGRHTLQSSRTNRTQHVIRDSQNTQAPRNS